MDRQKLKQYGKLNLIKMYYYYYYYYYYYWFQKLMSVKDD
jgi:hypothetical protein